MAATSGHVNTPRGAVQALSFVWSVATLTWVAATQAGGGGGGGGAVTVADGADVAEGSLADAAVQGDNPGTLSAKLRGLNKTLTAGITVSGTVTSNQGTSPWVVQEPALETLLGKYAFRLDYLAGTVPIYIGLAAPGSSTASAVWQIRKLTYDVSNNPTVIQYSNGSTAFNAIYDNRAVLAYS